MTSCDVRKPDHAEILRKFYGSTGLTEKWLRQRLHERQAFTPSKARIDRARSMAQLIKKDLFKRGDQWLLMESGTNKRRPADAEAAFKRGDGLPFNHIEGELFEALEARGEITFDLISHHATWRALQALQAADADRTRYRCAYSATASGTPKSGHRDDVIRARATGVN